MEIINYSEEQIKGMLAESTRELIEHLQKMQTACVDTAEQFRTNQVAQAQKNFFHIMRVNSELTDALIVVKPHLLKSNESKSETWTTVETHMTHTFRELLNSYESQDYVLVADILEYEVYTNMGHWIELLKD